MKYDLIIKNGHVIDPASGVDEVRDIAILEDKMVDYEAGSTAKYTIDATDCYVTPGIIDFHTHLFIGGSEYATNPEQMIATGVTAAVDAGTCGYATFGSFHKAVIDNTNVKIRSLLSVNPGVLIGPGAYHTNYLHGEFNVPRLKYMKEHYGDEILGLKIMLSIPNVGPDADTAISLLEETIESAEAVDPNMFVVVHTTNPPCTCDRIAKTLRKGDVYCHVYHGSGNTIIGEDGNVLPEIIEARKRGVIFDAANGFSHYNHYVVKQAFDQGFYPDIISSDLTTMGANRSHRCKNMPHLMSKYLSLGMSMYDVTKATTAVPAKLMGMEGKIGTLKAGAFADVAIFKIKNTKVRFEDNKDEVKYGDKLLCPQMVVCNGSVAFVDPEFNIL